RLIAALNEKKNNSLLPQAWAEPEAERNKNKESEREIIESHPSQRTQGERNDKGPDTCLVNTRLGRRKNLRDTASNPTLRKNAKSGAPACIARVRAKAILHREAWATRPMPVILRSPRSKENSGSIGCPEWRGICMRIGRKSLLAILLSAS